MTLSEMIAEYERLRTRKKELDDAQKENNAAIREIVTQITDQMVEDDKVSETQGDYKYSLTPRTEWNFLSADKMTPVLMERGYDSRMDVLQKNGMGYLVTETVNARSLSSDINARLDAGDEVPDDVAAILSKYDHNEISRTKISARQRKALAKAKSAREAEA